MLWFILAALIVFIVSIVAVVSCARERDYGAAVGYFFGVNIVGGAVALLFCILLNTIFSGILGYHYEKYAEYPIVALQDGASVSGSFFLGSGTISGRPVFFYYEKRDGAYHLKHVDADDASVVETGRSSKIEIYKTKANNELFGIPMMGTYDRYKFYTPNGSILRNFSLDAK